MRVSQDGFSLIEALLVSLLLVVVSGAVFQVLLEGQNYFQAEQSMAKVTYQSRWALDQISRVFRQAGNDPADTLGGIPIQLLGESHVQVRSDVTGSLPAASGDPKQAGGDPDGTLNSLFEQVSVRHEASSKRVLIDYGAGEEVLAENVSSLIFRFYDLAGNLTTDPAQMSRVEIELVAESPSLDPRTQQRQYLSFRSEVVLRSRAPSPFTEGGS